MTLSEYIIYRVEEVVKNQYGRVNEVRTYGRFGVAKGMIRCGKEGRLVRISGRYSIFLWLGVKKWRGSSYI